MNTLGIVVGAILLVIALQPEKAGEWIADFQKAAGQTCEAAHK